MEMIDDELLDADDDGELDYDLEKDEEDALLADPDVYEKHNFQTGTAVEKESIDQHVEEQLPVEEETDVLDIDVNVTLDETEEDQGGHQVQGDIETNDGDIEKHEHGRFVNERQRLCKTNTSIPDTLDKVQIITSSNNTRYRQRGGGYRGGVRGGRGNGGPRMNYSGRGGRFEPKVVLINQHFRGNIQPNENARLAWDTNSQGYGRGQQQPHQRYNNLQTVQVAPFQSQQPTQWVNRLPQYNQQQQQPKPLMMNEFNQPFQQVPQPPMMTTWAEAEQTNTSDYQPMPPYLPQDNFQNRTDPAMYGNNNTLNAQQPCGIANFNQRQTFTNDYYHPIRTNVNYVESQKQMLPTQQQQNCVPNQLNHFEQSVQNTFINQSQQQQMAPNQAYPSQPSVPVYHQPDYMTNNNNNMYSVPFQQQYQQQQTPVLPNYQQQQTFQNYNSTNYNNNRQVQQHQQYHQHQQKPQPLFSNQNQILQQVKRKQQAKYNNANIKKAIPLSLRVSKRGDDVRIVKNERDFLAKRKKRSLELSNLHQVTTVDMPDTTTTEDKPESEDEETKAYRMKIEEQKRLREKILREKEERRRLAVIKNANISSTVTATASGMNAEEMNIATTTPTGVQNITVVNKSQTQKIMKPLCGQQISTLHSAQARQNRGIGMPQANLKTINNQPQLNNIRCVQTIPQRAIKPNPPAQLPNIVIRTQKTEQQQQQQQQQCLVLLKPEPSNIVTTTTTETPNRRIVVAESTSNVNEDVTDANLGSFLANRKVIASQTHFAGQAPQEALMQTRDVIVSNLSAGTTELNIRQLCRSLGPIQNIEMIPSKRQAIIRFKKIISAHTFFKKYQRKILDLSMIQISLKAP